MAWWKSLMLRSVLLEAAEEARFFGLDAVFHCVRCGTTVATRSQRGGATGCPLCELRAVQATGRLELQP
jgi:hypothetical protein